MRLLAAALALATPLRALAIAKPNILFLLIDDLGSVTRAGAD